MTARTTPIFEGSDKTITSEIVFGSDNTPDRLILEGIVVPAAVVAFFVATTQLEELKHQKEELGKDLLDIDSQIEEMKESIVNLLPKIKK